MLQPSRIDNFLHYQDVLVVCQANVPDLRLRPTIRTGTCAKRPLISFKELLDEAKLRLNQRITCSTADIHYAAESGRSHHIPMVLPQVGVVHVV